MDNGTIMDHLKRNGAVDLNKRLLEVAEGLSYLHSKNVVHGDLRGSNILIGPDFSVVISDFGLAVFSDGRVGDTGSAHSGSTHWQAPELIRPEKFGLERFTRTKQSDIFAYGSVCFEVHTGEPPFLKDLVGMKISDGERPDRPVNDERCQINDKLWVLMSMCWSHQRERRPEAATVVETMRSWQQGQLGA
ncbi:kinase-like domain-containing protein [Mycena maculata]|uniref:Kinase-like domain-containing protein n=1 Tax=Mycena maculata TaxID=230809 RepID=A0AAD7K0F8_9AGAR|nr:kinase-like domain-containing protein [Mycena maculata]